MTNLHRVRHAVRGVLVLGMTASVAANVLHADPNPISKVIAAWPPIALLLAIELVIHVPVHRLAITRLRRAGTLLIAGIAAYVSYWHMAGVAARYGEQGLSVFLLPLSVDGLIAVASICLVELSGRLRAESVPEDKTPPGPRTAPPHMGGVRQDGGEQYPHSTTPSPVPAAAKPSVASVVRDAKAIHGDNRAAVRKVVEDTLGKVSDDTFRKSYNRAETNGYAHV